MPWPVTSPFRIRPHLEKLDPDSPELFLKDSRAAAYRAQKQHLLDTHRERCIVTHRSSSEMQEIGELILQRYGSASPPHAHVHLHLQAHALELDTPAIDHATVALQEDFVVLKNDHDVLRTDYLSVCFPSRWDPRTKLGLDFAQIHAPVADNAMLLAAGPSIMTMAFMKQSMLRHVWLIVPSASLPQHPDQNDYSWAETLRDPSPLLPRLFFRVERQTTLPLPLHNRAVFFIRVMMCSLLDALRVEPHRAHALREALVSMTPAVVAYRGMTEAMPRLLGELNAI